MSCRFISRRLSLKLHLTLVRVSLKLQLTLVVSCSRRVLSAINLTPSKARNTSGQYASSQERCLWAQNVSPAAEPGLPWIRQGAFSPRASRSLLWIDKMKLSGKFSDSWFLEVMWVNNNVFQLAMNIWSVSNEYKWASLIHSNDCHAFRMLECLPCFGMLECFQVDLTC